MAHPILSSPTLQRLTAWCVVIALHCLFGAWLLARHSFTPMAVDEPRLRLRWLPPEPRPLPATPAITQARQSVTVHPRITTVTRPTPMPATPADMPDMPTPPLDLSVPTPFAGGDGIDASTFAPRIIGRREKNPVFERVPRYFRLKPQLSPKEILENLGQVLGFWPAGYEVDPCKLSRRQINYFQNVISEQDRQVLKEALLSANAHCRQ